MRILMALGTLIERNADILRLPVRTIGVALRALHLQVQPGQRVACLGVIELAYVDLLPIDEVVARKTILAKASLVLILMAGGTGGGKAEIGSAEIFDLDRTTFLSRNVRGIMALGALQPCMLALENVPGIFVIEGFGIPLDQREIFTIVLGMTAGALLAGTARNVVGRVQALVSGKPGRDFGVTVQAFERRLAAEFMATCAIG